MEPPNDEQQLVLRKLAHLRIIARFRNELALGPYSTNYDRSVSRERRAQIWTAIKADVEAAGPDAYWAPGSLASLELFKYRNWCNWKMSAKRKYEHILNHAKSRCVLSQCDRFIISNIWGLDVPLRNNRLRRNIGAQHTNGAQQHNGEDGVQNNAAVQAPEINAAVVTERDDDEMVLDGGERPGGQNNQLQNRAEARLVCCTSQLPLDARNAISTRSSLEEQRAISDSVAAERMPEWARALVAEQVALMQALRTDLIEIITSVIKGRDQTGI